MTQETYFYTLALLYFDGRITPAQEKELYAFIQENSENRQIFQKWEAEYNLQAQSDPFLSDSWNRFSGRLEQEPVKRKNLFTSFYLLRMATPSIPALYCRDIYRDCV